MPEPPLLSAGLLDGQTIVAEGKQFIPARRVHEAFTASLEKRALQWIATRAPFWITSDRLTALGLAAQVGAGAGFALARFHRSALLFVALCIVLNWFGDSMDGTLARVRCQQRPRYGFYVDHIVDVFGATALMTGLGVSGFAHLQVAAAMLITFLLLSTESYLACYTLGRFELSQATFGPTELRLLLIAGTLALLRNPYATVFGHRMLLFDLGGAIASVCMLGLVIVLSVRHAGQLFREEPLP